MSRYIRNEAIGKPADFVDFIMNDFIKKHGFTLVNINGEVMYQKGKGFLEMPQYFSYRYMNGVIHIEAWVRFAWFPGVYGKEKDMSGVVGSVPKNAFKEDIDELIRVLYQPLPGEQQNPYGGYGQPVQNGMQNGYGQPVQNGMQNGYGQPMQNGTQNGYGQPVQNGMQNGYGQPVQNGMQNGYGQPMQNGMQNGYGQPMQNGMQGGYGQPVPNGPITVQGVDMKKRAKTGFVMSIIGIVFLALAVLFMQLDEEFDTSTGMVNVIWVAGMLYAGLGTGYSYRGMNSSKRGLAIGGFVLGVIGLIVGAWMLVQIFI